MVAANSRSRVVVRCSLYLVSALAILASAGQSLQAQSWGQNGVTRYTPTSGTRGAINKTGQVDGWMNPTSFFHVMTGSTNSLGQVGSRPSYASRDTAQHAFPSDGMTMPGLGTPGGDYNGANAINHAGQEVWRGYVRGDVPTPAVLSNAATTQGPATAGGAYIPAFDIYNAAQMGHSFLFDGTTMDDLYRAALRERDGTSDAPSPFTSIVDATTGQTAGCEPQRVCGPVLENDALPMVSITTTPEPASLALILTGFTALGGVMALRRRRARRDARGPLVAS